MPSIQVGLFSGGQILISGNPWSGLPSPAGFILLRWDRAAAGNIYVALSGGMKISSGGTSSSWGFAYSGLLDGMQLGPGDTYSIPKLALTVSGSLTIFGSPDAVASGNRLFYEVF